MALKSDMFNVYYVYCSHDSNIKKNYWRGSRAGNVKEHFVYFLYLMQFVHFGAEFEFPYKIAQIYIKVLRGSDFLNDTNNR